MSSLLKNVNFVLMFSVNCDDSTTKMAKTEHSGHRGNLAGDHIPQATGNQFGQEGRGSTPSGGHKVITLVTAPNSPSIMLPITYKAVHHCRIHI